MNDRSGAFGHKHTIHRNHQHTSWDNSCPAAITITPGDTVEFRDIDGAGGQLNPKSTADDIRTLDFSKINPIAGPVYVEGASPGDALKVTILSFDPSGWAWTAIVPGFGLLADDFQQPAINIWSYEKDFASPAAYGPGARVPLKPFCFIGDRLTSLIGPSARFMRKLPTVTKH
jgi:acetamidase/formamidase